MSWSDSHWSTRRTTTGLRGTFSTSVFLSPDIIYDDSKNALERRPLGGLFHRKRAELLQVSGFWNGGFQTKLLLHVDGHSHHDAKFALGAFRKIVDHRYQYLFHAAGVFL